MLLSLLLALALVAAACGGPTATTTTQAGATTTSAGATTTEAPGTTDPVSGSSDPVPIGVLTPLSQPGDPGSGQFFGRGAALAAEWVVQRLDESVWDDSCRMPVSLNLITFDDQGTPEVGIAGLRRLVQNDGVAAVVGQIHSSVMIALGPFAEELQVPVFAATASATAISTANHNFVFQAHAITSDRAMAVGDFLEANIGSFGRLAIVAENTDYGIGNVEDLKTRLSGVAGIEYQEWIFDRESRDLTALLLDVKNYDPDVIFNVSSTFTEYLMVEQANDVGLLDTAAMIISDDRPVRAEFWENVGDAGRNAIFVTYYHPDQRLTDAGAWFKDQYRARFGEDPVYTAYQGFGNTIVAAQAINQACSTDGADVAEALRSGSLTSWNADGVNFPQAEGVDWQRIKIPILLLQYTEPLQFYGDANIVFPESLATGGVILP